MTCSCTTSGNEEDVFAPPSDPDAFEGQIGHNSPFCVAVRNGVNMQVQMGIEGYRGWMSR